jgi:RNA polymerase sigma-70 factor, ECF subfamily
MSHPLGAPGGGRERPRNLAPAVNSALADQDPILRLIENLQKGIDVNESSRKLFELHYRKIVGFFRRKGFSAEESRDLTQDVFLRVFNAIDTFRRESRFERWLFEIALNIYRNKLRSKGAEKRDALEVPIDVPSDDEGTPGSGVQLVSEEIDALGSMVERERRAKLLAALKELPTQMRVCCELRYAQGLKYHEIATAMKISIETVKAHLHQARKRLTEKLRGK